MPFELDVWMFALVLAALSPWCVDLIARAARARVKKRTLEALAASEDSSTSSVERS